MTTKKNWRIAPKMVTVVRSIYGKVKKEEEVQVKKTTLYLPKKSDWQAASPRE